MSKSWIIGIIAAALAPFLGACNIKQPIPDCTVARGSFAVRYTPRGSSGSGACWQKKGEELGMDKFYPAIQTPDGFKQDLTRATLAIRSQTLGSLGGDPNHPVVSLGDFPLTPNATNICTVPQLSKAEQQVPASGTSPAVDIAYEWSDVRILNRSDALGTQVAATLRYTEGGCTATYDALAVWPATTCDDGSGQPDDRQCAPTANPDAGILQGSGINPLFPVKCDPDLLLCVLNGTFPALTQ